MLDGDLITEDLHGDGLAIPLDDCKGYQGAFAQVACFCQHVCAFALEIEPFLVESNVMQVSRRHTLVLLHGVAALNSVQKLTLLPSTTRILSTGNDPRLPADALLFTLRVGVEDVSILVVASVVGATALFHRHAGIPAQQVAVVALAPLHAAFVAHSGGGEAGTRFRTSRSAQRVMAVGWTGHGCEEAETDTGNG